MCERVVMPSPVARQELSLPEGGTPVGCHGSPLTTPQALHTPSPHTDSLTLRHLLRSHHSICRVSVERLLHQKQQSDKPCREDNAPLTPPCTPDKLNDTSSSRETLMTPTEYAGEFLVHSALLTRHSKFFCAALRDYSQAKTDLAKHSPTSTCARSTQCTHTPDVNIETSRASLQSSSPSPSPSRQVAEVGLNWMQTKRKWANDTQLQGKRLGWREGERIDTQSVNVISVNLPHERCGTFGHFVNWLYTGVIDESGLWRGRKPKYYTLLNIYALADRLECEGLRNACITCMARLAQRTNSVPTPHDTHTLYECGIRTNSPLHALVLDLYAFKNTGNLLATHKHPWHPTFLHDLCIRLKLPCSRSLERHVWLPVYAASNTLIRRVQMQSEHELEDDESSEPAAAAATLIATSCTVCTRAIIYAGEPRPLSSPSSTIGSSRTVIRRWSTVGARCKICKRGVCTECLKRGTDFSACEWPGEVPCKPWLRHACKYYHEHVDTPPCRRRSRSHSGENFECNSSQILIRERSWSCSSSSSSRDNGNGDVPDLQPSSLLDDSESEYEHPRPH